MHDKKIAGNLDGVRKIDIAALESLFETKCAGYCDPAIVDILTAFTNKYNREAAVLITRGGMVHYAAAGDFSSAQVAIESRRKG